MQKGEGLYAEIDEAEEKRIIRKVYWILLPKLFFTATLGAVDKQCLSTAAIYGFIEDNNLLGSQYSWLGSIIFIGYLVGIWPMTFILQNFRLGLVLVVASISTITAYIIGNVLISIGSSGLDLLNDILVGDLTPLKWRVS